MPLPGGEPHSENGTSHCGDGNEALALEYLRARNPFPGVTGRVCPHPCETGCNRNSYDEGVAIRALERHAADYGSAFRRMKRLPSTGKRIAVIGSGPGVTLRLLFPPCSGTRWTSSRLPRRRGRAASGHPGLPAAQGRGRPRGRARPRPRGQHPDEHSRRAGHFPLPRCWNTMTPA